MRDYSDFLWQWFKWFMGAEAGKNPQTVVLTTLYYFIWSQDVNSITMGCMHRQCSVFSEVYKPFKVRDFIWNQGGELDDLRERS